MSEVAVRDDRTPAQILTSQVRSDEFKEQAAMVLPDNVPPSRFVRATVTALMGNPKLAELERDSLYAALFKSAQDGLLPDGREAAIVAYGQKATYLPMIGGLRKIAAEYGWTIRAAVVYDADEFDYELGLDVRLVHKPAPVTADRGQRVAAYAVATHRDGRREIEVMSAADVEKVRQVSRAKDSGPWRDWTERMWEKTVGRRIFARLPLDPGDQRVARLVVDAEEIGPEGSARMLYGPSGATFRVVDEVREIGEGTEGTGGASTDPGAAETDSAAVAASSLSDQQAAAGADPDEFPGAPAAAPGASEPTLLDAAPEPAFKAPAAAVTKAGKAKPPAGSVTSAAAGLTLAEILAKGEPGREWLKWASEQTDWPEDFAANLSLFVQAKGVLT